MTPDCPTPSSMTAPVASPTDIDGHLSRSPFAGLASREAQVVAHVAMGWPNKRIAFELEIAVSTVASHLASAQRKLGLSTRLEVIASARGTEAIVALDDSHALTPAQDQVARLWLRGLRVGEIASARGCRRSTVRKHIEVIYRKSGVGSRAELLVLATSVQPTLRTG